MLANTFEAIVPAPAIIDVDKSAAVLAVADLEKYCITADCSILATEFPRLIRFYGLKIYETANEKDATIRIRENSSLGCENWFIAVSPQGVVLEGGDKNGVVYAFAAFAQILNAALVCGPAQATLNCGTVIDKPRFQWRGLHLDSARHFQSGDKIKKLIRIMAHLRLNKFHWHLTDNQGWRIESAVVPGMAEVFQNVPGQYPVEVLKGIAAFAAQYGIQIIPEIDVPGHSRGILSKYSELACNPENPGAEYCIGNPHTLKFLKKVFAELMDIFPDSPVIHLGGDEAATEHWKSCSRCQNALMEKGLKDMRELENSFMTELADFVSANGRIPMLWGNCFEQIYPANNLIQVWNGIRDSLKVAEHGNKVIYSVHNSLYFDYPENNAEPFESWMFALPEQGVYMTDPFMIWQEELKNTIIGTEACLWTERVPEWRLFPKIMPRIFAYAECAWSNPEQKDWYSFLRRREFLKASGYEEYLIDTI